MVFVTVIGSGAVGKFYGGLFTLSGCHVCYFERSDFSILQKNKYYEIELPDSSVVKIIPSQIENDYLLLPKSDIILIALKTTENHLLKKFLPPTLKPESKILLLQNGIGNEEYLSTLVKNHAIVCGVTTICSTRINPGYIQVKHFGELKLAPFTKDNGLAAKYIKHYISTNLSANLCPKIQLFENHRILRWTKLLWNTSFSILSLVFNTSVDVLASQKQYQNIVRTIMHEVCCIAKIDGAEIEKNIEELIKLTATLQGYYPSMYYDFKMGRPIESQYIVLHVIDYAESHRLHLPVLSSTYEKLMFLEKNGEWFSLCDQEEIYHQLNGISAS